MVWKNFFIKLIGIRHNNFTSGYCFTGPTSSADFGAETPKIKTAPHFHRAIMKNHEPPKECVIVTKGITIDLKGSDNKNFI